MRPNLIIALFTGTCGAFLFFAETVTAETRTPSELLQAYENSLNRLELIQFDAHIVSQWEKKGTEKYKGTEAWKVLRDGERWKLSCQNTVSESISGKTTLVDQSFNEYVAPATEGFDELRLQKNLQTDSLEYVIANRKLTEKGKAAFWAEGDFMLIFGYLQGNGKMMYLPEILRKSTLSVSQEVLGAHKVDVLTGKGAFGTYTLWLDPDFGFLPRRISVRKGLSDYAGDRQLSSWEGLQEMQADVKVLRLKKVSGVDVLAEFEITHKSILKDHETWSHTACSLSNINLTPDVSTTDAFKLSSEIPNDTPVQVNDASTIEYVWQDGRIVKVVDLELAKALDDQSFFGSLRSSRGWLFILSVVLFASVLFLFVRRRAVTS